MHAQFLALNDQILAIGDTLRSIRTRMRYMQGMAYELAEVEMLILMQRQATLTAQVATFTF